ncbi:Putative ribonuclease H protein At1g65750 [Linum perenne]
MEPPNGGDEEEDLVLGPEPKGIFSNKSAYQLIVNAGNPDRNIIWHIISKWEGPSRIKHFLWLFGHGRILTNVERCRCPGHVEDLLHFARDCKLASEVWATFLPPDSRASFFNTGLLEWLRLELQYGCCGKLEMKRSSTKVLDSHNHSTVCGIIRDVCKCSIMRAVSIGFKIAWDLGYKMVHLQMDSLAAVEAILADASTEGHRIHSIRSI